MNAVESDRQLSPLYLLQLGRLSILTAAVSGPDSLAQVNTCTCSMALSEIRRSD